MANKTKRDDSLYLDPVFLQYGQKVYTYDLIEEIREENLKLKSQGKHSFNLVPQKGFQERVCEADADLLIIGGRKGGGKVTPNDTKIVTPFGYRQLGDLKVGDIISNPTNGRIEWVTDIYEHPKHDFYVLIFEDGTCCECGMEHLWNVRIDNSPYQTWPFEKIKQWMDNPENKGRPISTPICAPVVFASEGVEDLSESEIQPIIEKIDNIINNRDCEDYSIPEKYLWGELSTRYRIIREILDRNAKINDNGKIVFHSFSRIISLGLRHILHSLGCVVAIQCDGYCDKIRITCDHPERLFNSIDKIQRCKELNISNISRKIIGYKHTGQKDGRCITVDGKDGLYMTQGFVVTHNTFIALYKALPYMFNPDVSLYAFRKLEDDVKRGPWKSSQPIFRAFGTPKDSYFEWSFLGGKGATMKMEHLQDLGKITDRFRGAEMAYIDIEELPEHTRDSIQIIFDLLAVNRNTAGVRSQVVATCNPVGKSNKLRQFLDWYINPETDEVIPERSGKKRFMFNWGSDITQIAWGDSWEEVYAHPKAKEKIDVLLMGAPDMKPEDMILTLQFIEGEYADNKILQIADKKYVSRLASGGGAAVVNDMRGIWRDVESGDSLLSIDDMEAFFTNTERRDGVMRASADVALAGDFFVIWAFNGHHVCDMEAWFGAPSDEVVPFIRKFLKKNGVREDHFTYDKNGLGLWLEGHFKSSSGFNNKAAASDSRLWNNLKSEAAEKFIKGIKNHEYSIDTDILMRHLTDKKGHSFTIRERLLEERFALKRKESNEGRFEIISKQQMKTEIGHSPDFIEGLFMVVPLFASNKKCIRKGFENM